MQHLHAITPLPQDEPTPEPPPPEQGDPGWQPPVPVSVPAQDPQPPVQQPDSWRHHLAELGAEARKGKRHEYALMMLLAGLTTCLEAAAHALTLLEPSDMDGKDKDKQALADALMATERALHAQEPPKQAAE